VNELRFAEQIMVQSLTGAVAGGILMFLVGILKHNIEQHRSLK
jgi:hypothetical protein